MRVAAERSETRPGRGEEERKKERKWRKVANHTKREPNWLTIGRASLVLSQAHSRFSTTPLVAHVEAIQQNTNGIHPSVGEQRASPIESARFAHLDLRRSISISTKSKLAS